MKPSKITRSAEFEHDLKKLLKRFSTLEEDLETFIKTASLNVSPGSSQCLSPPAPA